MCVAQISQICDRSIYRRAGSNSLGAIPNKFVVFVKYLYSNGFLLVCCGSEVFRVDVEMLLKPIIEPLFSQRTIVFIIAEYYEMLRAKTLREIWLPVTATSAEAHKRKRDKQKIPEHSGARHYLRPYDDAVCFHVHG